MKQTFFKRLCILLSCLLLLSALTACALPTDGTEESSETETIYVPESGEPTEELLEQIKKDYYKDEHGTMEGYDPEVADGIVKCYGIYHGCVPVIINHGCLFRQYFVEVAGIQIYYLDSREIQVWKNGNFFTLQGAYNQELLTKEDIQTIASLHNEHNKW